MIPYVVIHGHVKVYVEIAKIQHCAKFVGVTIISIFIMIIEA